MTWINAPCDLCGGRDFGLLYPSTVAPDAPQDARWYYSSSRRIAAHLPIVRCRNCGLVMTNPRDDAATLRQVYDSLEDEVYEAESENRRRTARDQVRLIARYIAAPGRLLDIGCATGIFLAEAQQAGWQVSGIEPSLWAAEHAVRRLVDGDIRQVGLEQAMFAPDAFNVITLWDVLEHVDSPVQTMHTLSDWLQPGGYVFLNLPNIASRSARLLGGRWPLLLREHLWYFSPASLGQLLEQTGFRLMKCEPNWVYFSLNNILKRLGQYPQTAVIERSLPQGSPVRNIRLRFPMGEMRAVAVKTS